MATYRKSDDGDGAAAAAPDKMTVFQQSVSAFNQSSLSASKARRLLTQLVHLLYLGETFPEAEASQLFFTISKLFQKENAGLRQMVFLAIKELTPFTDNVIMGTSVLMKDVQSSGEESQVVRPNALRTLCRILDASSVEGIDRMMRTALVDTNPAVSSAALVSAYNLLGTARDTVRRWATETQDVLSTASGSGGIQEYHALGLLYHMRSHDRVGLVKLIQQIGDAFRGQLHSPHALVLHVRYIGQVLEGPHDPKLRSSLVAYLRGYLRHRSDIVNLEAAKMLLSLKAAGPEDVDDAIHVLQAYLGSPRAPARFAAIRTLNRFAMAQPVAVAVCNAEIEALIADPNRSIATYAITALLKTGSEDSVDHLIEQIGTYMDDIGDDFRVVVVDAIRSLAQRFQHKHSTMLQFYAGELKLEGGLALKMAVVEAINDIVHTEKPDSEALGQALATLCDTIEDCEFPEVVVHILHILGAVGPHAPGAAQYVRHIYNRVVLENSVVRAAAVSALARFAAEASDPALQRSVKTLLKRCLADPNDEVRDRAAIALAVGLTPLPTAKLSMSGLEESLLAYMADPSHFSKPFDASSVARISDTERRRPAAVASEVVEAPPTPRSESVTPETPPADESQLRAIPEVAQWGQLLRSGAPQQLTDSEMEYVVQSRVHVFADNRVLLQYIVHNTYDCVLEDVGVIVETDDLEDQIAPEFIVAAPRLAKDDVGSVFVGCTIATPLVVGNLPSRLRFIFKEFEDDDGSEEEYAMDDLELVVGNYVAPTYIGSWDHQWDELANAEETATRQFSQCSTLEEAITYLTQRLGMAAADSTGDVSASESTHTLKLAGKTASGGLPVAVRVRLVRSSRAGIAGKLQIRSPDSELSELVAAGV